MPTRTVLGIGTVELVAGMGVQLAPSCDGGTPKVVPLRLSFSQRGMDAVPAAGPSLSVVPPVVDYLHRRNFSLESVPMAMDACIALAARLSRNMMPPCA